MNSEQHALELLRRVYVSGATVEISERGTLGLKGHTCPEPLKAELKEHRDAILAILTAQGIGRAADSGTQLKYAVPCGNTTCRILGPCGQHLTLRPCGLTTMLPDDARSDSKAA